MARVTFELNPIKTKAFQKTLDRYIKKMPQEVGKILKQEGDKIMVSSKESFVPKDLGVLANDGIVANPEFKGKGVRVRMGYGRIAKAYAVATHEHPSQHSPPSWKQGVNFNVGGPKYLEKPLRLAANGMGARIAKKLRQFLIRNA